MMNLFGITLTPEDLEYLSKLNYNYYSLYNNKIQIIKDVLSSIDSIKGEDQLILEAKKIFFAFIINGESNRLLTKEKAHILISSLSSNYGNYLKILDSFKRTAEKKPISEFINERISIRRQTSKQHRQASKNSNAIVNLSGEAVSTTVDNSGTVDSLPEKKVSGTTDNLPEEENSGTTDNLPEEEVSGTTDSLPKEENSGTTDTLPGVGSDDITDISKESKSLSGNNNELEYIISSINALVSTLSQHNNAITTCRKKIAEINAQQDSDNKRLEYLATEIATLKTTIAEMSNRLRKMEDERDALLQATADGSINLSNMQLLLNQTTAAAEETIANIHKLTVPGDSKGDRT